jgi:hypothetical protein
MTDSEKRKVNHEFYKFEKEFLDKKTENHKHFKTQTLIILVTCLVFSVSLKSKETTFCYQALLFQAQTISLGLSILLGSISLFHEITHQSQSLSNLRESKDNYLNTEDEKYLRVETPKSRVSKIVEKTYLGMFFLSIILLTIYGVYSA